MVRLRKILKKVVAHSKENRYNFEPSVELMIKPIDFVV